MSDHPPDQPDRSGSDRRRTAEQSSLRRRSVIAALGTAAAGSALAPATAGALEADGPTAPAVELDAFDLPSWRQTERHEAATSPVDNPRSASNVLGRRIVRVKRNLSQVNMKLWENEDAARTECDGTVGHQHRFIASTILYTAEKADLSWHYDQWVRTTSQLPALRNPPLRGRSDHGQMSTRARIADGAPNADACGPLTFRINNVYWNRLPMSELARRDDGDDAASLYGDYGTEDLREDVRDFQRGRGAYSPYVPEDDDGLASLAEDVLGPISDPKVGLQLGLAEEALDGLSGYDEAFKYAATDLGKISKAADVAGLANDTIAFLDALDGLGDYEGFVEWADDGVYVGSGERGGGAVDVQFVDFTITVPPGEADPDGTTVEVVQNYGLEPDGMEPPNYYDGHAPDSEGLVQTEFTWEIDIPGYTADDFDGVDESRLPTASVRTDDGTTPFADAPTPDPSIAIDRSGTTETDAITFEADAPDTGADATYRWRIYKNGGKIRPATLFGESATLASQTLRRGSDPTVEAFGPGQYVAELTVQNRYGKTTTVAETFSVDPVSKDGTEAAIDAPVIEVTQGETVTLSAAGSVGHDGTTDSVTLIEWEIQYPSAVTGGVVDGDAGTTANIQAGVDAVPFKPPKRDATQREVQHTFEEVGIYRAALRVYSLDDSFDEADRDPSNVQAVYYDRGDRIHADKRDVTVVVTPAEADDGLTPAGGPLPSGGESE